MNHDNETCNHLDNTPFEKILETRLSRRDVLIGGLTLGIASFLPKTSWSLGNLHLMQFEQVSILDGTGPMPAISEDYQYDVLIPWASPLEPRGPQAIIPPVSADDQARQIGIGHDGMAFFSYPQDQDSDRANNRGLLALNHEFGINSHVLGKSTPQSIEEVRISQHAHGISIVALEKQAGKWLTVNSEYSRRIHVNTPVKFSGPAAASPLLKNAANNLPLGTVNNCSCGVTPWGTYLTCEENFNGNFAATKNDWQATKAQKRYGIKSDGFGYGWQLFDPRFDLTDPDYQNEQNRFGWVVEIDPFNPAQKPVKRTALGRFKHEGAAVTVGKNGHVVVYMGDDQRGDYIYRFVSAHPYQQALEKGISPLDEGQLSVAKFNDDGSGQWLALTIDDPKLAERFSNQAEVLIYARIAADLVGATPMDRPEWTTVAPNGDVYCSLTNNRHRKDDGKFFFDAANPRETEEFDLAGNSIGNASGHIIRWHDTEEHSGNQFKWNIFLIARDTQGSEEVFSAPDGLYADPDGRLFIETDGSQKDGLNNQLLVADTTSKEIRRLFTGVPGDEITGLTMTPDRRTLFINCQHPGKGDPRISNFPAQPDGKTIPRDCTLVITRKDGGIIGS